MIAELCISGCAPTATIKPGYDFSRIRSLSVAKFEGEGGPAVSNELLRELVGSRLEVSDRSKGADATLSGAVTEYKPSQKLLVFLGNTHTVSPNGQTIVVSNPVVSLSGTQVTSQGPAFGLDNTQVITVSASVGVIARLVDVRTGSVVWSDEYSYEGLDVQGALQAVAGSLVRSLQRALPSLQKP